MPATPIYQGHEFEVLKVRYQEHAALLRHLNDFDWRVVYGFMTIQLILGGWFAQHSATYLVYAIAILIVDTALFFCGCMVLRTTQARRREAVDTIWNINDAFGLTKVGVYLDDRAINPKPPSGRPYFWYAALMLAGLTGVTLLLLSPLSN